MSSYQEQFISYTSIDNHSIQVANKTVFNALEVGSLCIKVLKENGIFLLLILKDILYAPGLHATLVSLGKFEDKGCICYHPPVRVHVT